MQQVKIRGKRIFSSSNIRPVCSPRDVTWQKVKKKKRERQLPYSINSINKRIWWTDFKINTGVDKFCTHRCNHCYCSIREPVQWRLSEQALNLSNIIERMQRPWTAPQFDFTGFSSKSTRKLYTNRCTIVQLFHDIVSYARYSLYYLFFLPIFLTLPLLGETSSREVRNRVFRGITSRPNKNRSRSKKINNRFSAFCLRFLDSLLRIRFQMGKRETTILLLGGPEPTNQNKHTRNWIKVSPRYIPLI